MVRHLARFFLLVAMLLMCATSAGSGDAPPTDTDGGGAGFPPFSVDPICPPAGAESPLPSADSPRSTTAQAGTIEGAFSASPSGEATYSMPLVVPPGRAGMSPPLAISYDSAGGDGVLGVGFSIQGLSSIARCPKNMAQDGEIDPVRYDDTDRYCLDGRRLVLIALHGSEDSQKATLEYRTFPDSFTRVIAHFDSHSELGPSRFTAYLKSGLTMEYGSAASGQVLGLGGVRRSWWVTRAYDRNANTIDFTYQNDIDPDSGHTRQHAPTRIDYTGHVLAAASRAVAFDYVTKELADQRILCSGGARLESTWRLDRIRMLGPGEALVRDYRFGYEKVDAPTHRTRLARVEECGADDVCKPGTRFTWHHGAAAPGFTEQTTDVKAPISPFGSTMFLDVTGDGLDDLLTTNQNVAFSPGGYDGSVKTTWHVAENAGDAGVPLAPSSLWLEDGHAGNYESGFQPEVGTPIDYNQDGRMDVFMHDVYAAYPTWQVLIARPDKTFDRVDTGVWRPPSIVGVPALSATDDAAHLADVDGDGTLDLLNCHFDGVWYQWALHLWRPDTPSGPGFEEAGRIVPNLQDYYPCSWSMQPVDVNGDGKTELLTRGFVVDNNGFIQPTTAYDAMAYLGVASAPDGLPSSQWQVAPTGLPVSPAGLPILFLDVNGDGLPDAVDSDAQQLQLRTFVNTGAGFGPARASVLGALKPAEFLRFATTIDHDNDGRQDLLLPFRNGDNQAPFWAVLRSTGTDGNGTFEILDSGLPMQATLADAGFGVWDANAPRVTDIDGDGSQDVVLALDGQYRVFKNVLHDEDVLETIADGMNGRDASDPGFVPNVQIAYGHLVDSSITRGFSAGTADFEAQPYLSQTGWLAGNLDTLANCEHQYPVRCVVGSRRVVSGYALNNGANGLRRFAVDYRGGRFDKLGRGFLGFGARVVRDLGTGAGTVEFYDTSTYDEALRVFPFAGQVQLEWRYSPGLPSQPDPDLVEMTRAQSIFQERTTYGGLTYFVQTIGRSERRAQGSFPAGGGSGLTLLQYVADNAGGGGIEKSRTSHVVADYDSYGNVKSESTTTEGTDTDLHVTRSFLNDETTWLLGLLTSESTCSNGDGGKQCRTRERGHDTRGQVVEETRADGDDDPETRVRTTFARDGFGNITKTTAYDAFGHHRRSCTAYDAEGVSPIAEGDPAGHVSWVRYSPGFGAQTAHQDANGLVTTWQYDALGRLSGEARPDGTTTTYSRTRTQDGGATGHEWNVKLRTHVSGGADDTVEYDALGRVVRRWSQNLPVVKNVGGFPVLLAQRIVEETEYDALGEHIARRSLPAAEGTPLLWLHNHTYEYDAIGRVVRHETPWGAVTTYAYPGRQVVVTDPKGKTTTEDRDPLGRPESVTDAEGGVTSYGYGPFGLLRTVTDPGGAVTTTMRDAYGRVRLRMDPDRGPKTMHYDGFGQQTWSADAADRFIAYAHDTLGRLVRRDDQDGTTRWKWDTAAHGIGQLASVTSPGGAVERYGYDDFGRLDSMELTAFGDSFTVLVDRDTDGRVDHITYPAPAGTAPFVVQNQYDRYGRLTAVRDAATGTLYWQLGSTDSAGRIDTETFGNGTSTDRDYYDNRDRLSRLRTTAGAKMIQNLQYAYDSKLNLETRTDALLGVTEAFGYDDLDRLTCATIPGVAYVDAKRGCTASYDYDPDGNLVNKAGVGDYVYDPGQPHAAVKAGTDVFGYDAVGNQIARPDATVTYTAFDLPSDVTPAGVGSPVHFDYDGDGVRIRKASDARETVYVGDLYERVTDHQTGSVEHRYHVRSATRVVAVVLRSLPKVDKTLYLHVDHLGSVEMLTGDGGAVHEHRSYDAFGARRDPSWAPAPGASFSSPIGPGFTGHEDEDELGLINMKGRLYDPRLARFVSADTVVSRPGFGQSWNPYSYVLNSPLNYVDPTGHEPYWQGPATLGEDILVVAPDDGSDAYHTYDSDRTAPGDVSIDGNHAGYAPQAPATPEQIAGQAWSCLRNVGEFDYGVLRGIQETELQLAFDTLLNASTFGAYGAHQMSEAMLSGWHEDGWVGALNAVNPLYGLVRGAADVYINVDNDDYRAAGAAAGQTTTLAVAMVLGAGEGSGALPARAEAGAARGGAITSGSQVTEQVIRGAMKDAPLASQQVRGVSLPRVQQYVDRLIAGETAPAIKVDGRMIVDGNHRYIAGRILGQEPAIQPWAGGRPGSAVSWDKLPINPEAW